MRDTRVGGGQRLKEARAKIGITRKALAEELGVSANYLYLIEAGYQPISVPIATALQEKHGVDAMWLLYATTRKGEKSRLRQARDFLGLKQKDMAAKLGISAMYLGLMERDEQPVSMPVAEKMQNMFGINIAWLLYGSGEMTRSEE